MVERGKPFPDLFLFAAAKMGFAPDRALVIEDSVPGLMAAQAAGAGVVAYTGGSHLRTVADSLVTGISSFDSWSKFGQVLQSFRDVRTLS
jgi:beta-phosphoglucomutase-like phosphatase (HAD superfamily)